MHGNSQSDAFEQFSWNNEHYFLGLKKSRYISLVKLKLKLLTLTQCVSYFFLSNSQHPKRMMFCAENFENNLSKPPQYMWHIGFTNAIDSLKCENCREYLLSWKTTAPRSTCLLFKSFQNIRNELPSELILYFVNFVLQTARQTFSS